jgi:hypothetical protein
MFVFDPLIFFHALYVGLTYALMAFGAMYYRQFHDDTELRKIRLGEDLFTFSDPAARFAVIVLCVLFCIFVLLALTHQPKTLIYVIPIAIAINIVQMVFRLRRQQGRVKTQGIIVRYMLFQYGCIGISYNDLVCVDIQRELFWYKLLFFTEETKVKTQCRMSEKSVNTFIKVVKSRSDCTIVFPHDEETESKK